jgi:hypothetical protein
MKDLFKKIFKKRDGSVSAQNARTNEINETTNAVFKEYKKCFKDLARYDREGNVGAD